ncbi:hypothetical protein PESP_a0252 [Pseudoalteromonas espejiana DSM 9414]|nr:hypothetical protein PESP_a0252 [Pseudoalteromonas espejiana DSM 9414]
MTIDNRAFCLLIFNPDLFKNTLRTTRYLPKLKVFYRPLT